MGKEVRKMRVTKYEWAAIGADDKTAMEFAFARAADRDGVKLAAPTRETTNTPHGR